MTDHRKYFCGDKGAPTFKMRSMSELPWIRLVVGIHRWIVHRGARGVVRGRINLMKDVAPLHTQRFGIVYHPKPLDRSAIQSGGWLRHAIMNESRKFISVIYIKEYAHAGCKARPA